MNSHTSLDTLRQSPHWSFSSISGLVGFCSLKWAFQRVYREEPMFTPVALVFGKVYHSVLAYVFNRIAWGKSVGTDECEDLLADLLTRNIRDAEPIVKMEDGETVDTLIEQGRNMLEAYLDSIDPEEQVHGVSVPFSVPLRTSDGFAASKPLIGEFDLTVMSGGRYTIVDWKTSARKWSSSKAANDLQPTCYLYAHHASTGQEADFRFDVVTKTKTPACERHPARRDINDFDRLVRTVIALERMVQAEAFVPTDGSWECKSCPYSLACQSWHRQHASAQVTFAMAA